MKANDSAYLYVPIWLFTTIVSFIYHIGKDEISVISWDVYGYYLYLPAILKYGDTTQFAFAMEHLSQYPISEELYQLMQWNGVKAPIYTVGMALIYLPFYLIAEAVAYVLPGYAADAMSPVYQWSIIMGSWVYNFIGIKYADKILGIFKMSTQSRILTLLVIFLGTNYFHYTAFENGMPHHFLFTLYILLIHCTIRWHQEHKVIHIVSGSILISLLCLARPSEVVCILIPLFYGIYNGLSGLIKWNKFLKYRHHLLMMIVTGLFIISIQVIYWKINLNEWIFNGYQGHHFDFWSPHIIEGVFSFRKGWLIYSPLCLLGILGIPLIWKYDKRWMLATLTFLIINIYIVLSWHIWWYASSFGMRALIQSYAVLMIPLAFFIEWMGDKNWKRYLIWGIGIAGIFLNQFQDWQYRNKILLQDEMNAVYYKKSFFRTGLDRNLRKYIDVPEEYCGDQSTVLMELYSPEKADTVLPGDFSYTHRIPARSIQGWEAVPWIKVEAHLSMNGSSFNSHQQARLVTAQKKDNDNIKWRGVRFQQMMEEGEEATIEYDFMITTPASEDEYIEVTIWNNGPDTILLKTLKVYHYN